MYPVEPEDELPVNYLRVDEAGVEVGHIEAVLVVPESGRAGLESRNALVALDVHLQHVVREPVVGEVGPESVHGHVSHSHVWSGQVAVSGSHVDHLKNDSFIILGTIISPQVFSHRNAKPTHLIGIFPRHQLDSGLLRVQHFPPDKYLGREAHFLVQVRLVVQGVDGESHVDHVAILSRFSVIA
ncbi:hypothetical protein AVEN_26957-1 [Araneus ventricosus]|uniref:Uncharacterized protein n=1 Tax=Araneus ventricosus TaxID=182803 RepID=A0A4Y2VY95_ARAVE|nr:hypothetical protein AVEN_26957-1 [Araneus ventricosus]